MKTRGISKEEIRRFLEEEKETLEEHKLQPTTTGERLSICVLWLRAKFPIFLTLGLIYFLATVYGITYLLEEVQSPLTKLLVPLFAVLFLLVNISLFRAVFTNPGRLPSKTEWDVDLSAIETEKQGS